MIDPDGPMARRLRQEDIKILELLNDTDQEILAANKMFNAATRAFRAAEMDYEMPPEIREIEMREAVIEQRRHLDRMEEVMAYFKVRSREIRNSHCWGA